MADFLTGLGHSLGVLADYLGIRSAGGLEAVFYILGATTFLVLCAAVHSAVRMALLRCPVRK